MSRFLPVTVRVLILALLFTPLPALALSSAPYVSTSEVDLTRILPPPPEAGSDAQNADLSIVRTATRTRGPEATQRVIDDANVSVARFADVMGPDFTAAKLPQTYAFLTKAGREASALVGQAKDYWKRPRPFVADPTIVPPGNLAKTVTNLDGTVSYSYPSGHSTFGALMAILLSEMVPEKRDVLFARGWEFGRNRVLAGVHFPTDVESGRIDASIAAALMMQKPQFRADLAEARAELRRVLGLVP